MQSLWHLGLEESLRPRWRANMSGCLMHPPGWALTFTSSKGKRSWKMRLIRAPPDSSSVSTWSPEPSIRFSKSTPNCWTILQGKKKQKVKMEISAQPCNYMSCVANCLLKLHVLIGGRHATVYEWNHRVLWESELCFYHVSLGDRSQGISLGSKHVYPLSQPVSLVTHFLVFHILLFLNTRSCCVNPASLEVKTFLPRPPKH